MKEHYDVSFQIFGTNMNPDFISGMMVLVPDEISAPGDVVGVHEGKECTTDIGSWSIVMSSEEKQTEEQIEELLEILHPRKKILEELKNQGWKVRFFCGIFSEDGMSGASLSSKMLEEVGGLGIDIDIACYFVKD